MGRTEPTVVKPPAAFRRDARAKRARATLNKVIPALLSAHPRARRGVESSELIVDPPALHRRGVAREGGGKDGPRITLRIADTLTAAQSLLDPGPSPSPPPLHQHKRQGKRRGSKEDGAHTAPDSADAGTKVGILNMASPLSPGGGFLNGATSQEESLCMRTTLLPALRDEFYRLPELGVVYTPDVLVFRSAGASAVGSTGDDENDVLPKNDRWFVHVASAAMLRLPETEDGRYAKAADRELAERKMRAVLRVLCAAGCNRVVLGAWGCGAYGNPVAEIAEAWRRVLRRRGGRKGGRDKKPRTRDKEAWGAFIDEVVFAIKDPGMAASFARAFGEDILPLPTSRSGGDGDGGSMSSTTGDGGEDAAEVARVSEVWEKIAQLEMQVEQVRSPHLKLGLETVLAGLRRQLPLGEEEEEEEEEEASSGLEPGIGHDHT
ncbi:hypothetical protein F5X97DRAFT_340154 [Nemania serpens]|nr:hypothetical protein F5X97DRAFT_340154 [Nemania serpens]